MSFQKLYFISDVHLGLKSKEEEKIKENKLLKFLTHIQKDANELYIVGDLFDCWIEYRKVIPKGYFKLLTKLNEMSESGISINFLSGNHDFWLNTYLAEEVGMNIYRDFIELERDKKRFYITHGDGLSYKDRGYKIIKKLLRNRMNQFLYSLIHPDIGIAIAQKFSRKSRNNSEEKAFGSEGMRRFAEKKIREGYDYVIMGHLHKPRMTEINTRDCRGYSITIGDWIKHDSYGEFFKGSFELKYWSDNL